MEVILVCYSILSPLPRPPVFSHIQIFFSFISLFFPLWFTYPSFHLFIFSLPPFDVNFFFLFILFLVLPSFSLSSSFPVPPPTPWCMQCSVPRVADTLTLGLVTLLADNNRASHALRSRTPSGKKEILYLFTHEV